MSVRDPEKVRRTCDIFERAVKAGADRSAIVRELAIVEGVQRPAIWRRLRSGGVLPPYSPSGHSKSYLDKNLQCRKAAEQRMAARLALESAPRVDRDPCPRCGVRRDVGCGRSLAPLGTVL